MSLTYYFSCVWSCLSSDVCLYCCWILRIKRSSSWMIVLARMYLTHGFANSCSYRRSVVLHNEMDFLYILYCCKSGLLKLLLAKAQKCSPSFTFACARGHCFKRTLLCSPENYCARTMTVEKERSNLLTNILSLKSAEFIVIFVLWLAA